MKTCVRLASVAALFLSMACGNSQKDQMQNQNQDNIDEVQYGVVSASSVGFAASLSLDAIAGKASVCAAVKTACTTYPCNGAVTVNFGAGCPLPLGGVASGSVQVSGQFASADSSTLTEIYENASVSSLGKALAVAKVNELTAQRSGTTILVHYVGTSAVAGATGTAIAVGGSATWDVTVDTQGTADPTDDKLTVQANSQSASGFGARLVTVNSAVLDPSCRKNPISGSADISEFSAFGIKSTKVQFHSACDGQADVNGTATALVLLP